MSVALARSWTAEEFLRRAAAQVERHKFDGRAPVATTGGSAWHNRIIGNIHAALRARLRGTGCSYYGPGLGVRTVVETIRFPDALITCTKFPDTARVAPGVVVVFEVLSPESGRRDRVEKVREYAAVGSILRYVLVESAEAGLLVLHRQARAAAFTALPLTLSDMLDLPEAGIQVPVAEIYENLEPVTDAA